MAGLLDSYADCLAAARKRPGYVEVTNVLKVIRLSKLREPRTVVEFGSLALSKFKGSLGDEKWTIYEQVLAACLVVFNDEGTAISAMGLAPYIHSTWLTHSLGARIACMGL